MINRIAARCSAWVLMGLGLVPSVHAADFDCLIEPAQTIELATLESSAEQAAAALAQYKSRLEGPTR